MRQEKTKNDAVKRYKIHSKTPLLHIHSFKKTVRAFVLRADNHFLRQRAIPNSWRCSPPQRPPSSTTRGPAICDVALRSWARLGDCTQKKHDKQCLSSLKRTQNYLRRALCTGQSSSARNRFRPNSFEPRDYHIDAAAWERPPESHYWSTAVRPLPHLVHAHPSTFSALDMGSSP